MCWKVGVGGCWKGVCEGMLKGGCERLCWKVGVRVCERVRQDVFKVVLEGVREMFSFHNVVPVIISKPANFSINSSVSTIGCSNKTSAAAVFDTWLARSVLVGLSS